MDEGEAVALLMAFWAVLAYAVYLRVFVVRPLRKTVRRVELENARLTAAPVAVPSTPTEPGDLRRIQDRLQVLERIAVEKENSLTRKIEDLRAAQG